MRELLITSGALLGALLLGGASSPSVRRRATQTTKRVSRGAKRSAGSAGRAAKGFVKTASGKRYKVGSEKYKAYMKRLSNLRKARAANKRKK